MAFDLNSLMSQGGGGGAASLGEGLAGATPYGAMANAAKGVADAVFGGGASSTSGDIGDVSNNFGGVMIGTDALYSPGAFAAPYTSRRLATGQTAAVMPGVPAGRAVMTPEGVAYTSTVSASNTGIVLTAGAALLGLLALVAFKKKG